VNVRPVRLAPGVAGSVRTISSSSTDQRPKHRPTFFGSSAVYLPSDHAPGSPVAVRNGDAIPYRPDEPQCARAPIGSAGGRPALRGEARAECPPPASAGVRISSVTSASTIAAPPWRPVIDGGLLEVTPNGSGNPLGVGDERFFVDDSGDQRRPEGPVTIRLRTGRLLAGPCPLLGWLIEGCCGGGFHR
jgi:hypothetical protein